MKKWQKWKFIHKTESDAIQWWNSGLKEVLCGEIIDKKVEVNINILVLGKIKYLMELCKDYEWCGDLLGEIKDNTIKIYEMSIPIQNVGTATATPDRKKSVIPQNCVGVIHSHHSMIADFSETDNNFANANHKISIVVNNSDNENLPFTLKGTVKINTRCGNYVRRDVKILIEIPNVKINTKNILKKESSIYNHLNYELLKETQKNPAPASINSCGFCHCCGSYNIEINIDGEYCSYCQNIYRPSKHGWENSNIDTKCSEFNDDNFSETDNNFAKGKL